MRDPTTEGPEETGEVPLPPDVLTVDELAALLRVERKTAYAAIARGEIPGVRRIGTRLRISRTAVLTWLAQGQGCVSRSRRGP
jgi:excisionase family DNA binding protein